MPANNTSGLVHYLAGLAPKSIGHLYTPARKEHPKSWLPYALDNGAFALASRGADFDEEAWRIALEFFAHHAQPPHWLVVPDVPFDGERTVELWKSTAHTYKQFHVPLALAVQDGMTPESVHDLEVQPDVIFIGGTTAWKWDNVRGWCQSFERVHVARVNGRAGLDICQDAGAESCDGSGWFRGNPAQLEALVEFIAEHNNLDRRELLNAVASTRLARSRQGVLRL